MTQYTTHPPTERFRGIRLLAQDSLVTKQSFIPLLATRAAVGYAWDTGLAVEKSEYLGVLSVWDVPHGARSAAGGESALSLRLMARGDGRPGTTTKVGEWCTASHWRFERLSFAYFSLPAAAKKSRCRPAQGQH